MKLLTKKSGFKLHYLAGVMLVLGACSNETPQFKQIDQYNPLSVAIGRAYLKKFENGIGSKTVEQSIYNAEFNTAFMNSYGVDIENALIACAERDVVENMSDQTAFFKEQWFGDSVNDNAFSVYIGNKQLKDVMSECMTPMANKVYQALNR